ncbi:hypothetical protein [Acidocella aminolytica]|uniref:Uncharacterized protein n=1 Tax=Acidocella aminolytica 101 = DSM 11237 TaxID=1120923 RepID=A0A0D6PA57_9PROT|nr:hypothetical protein [Acidocella aminolytica]GAN78615.1 hypothetical protein Aam_005_014 [Acidocella aminolytica 101 = DSM 11237]GBQ35522.1 hypothetical protein AA11237_0994 [Acidocella aminolytica 101 = DSM 11237]SHE43358.1 hypothetical protein SAMN02746095_00424 [Acidocella aminolytica 101 = DSM 11237]
MKYQTNYASVWNGERELLAIAEVMRSVLPPEATSKLLPCDAELFAVQFTAAILQRLLNCDDEAERRWWRVVAEMFARHVVYGPNGPQG